MVQPRWKTVWQFLKMLNVEVPYHPAILPLGIYSKEVKTYVHTKPCKQMVIAALFIMDKTQNNPIVP